MRLAETADVVRAVQNGAYSSTRGARAFRD